MSIGICVKMFVGRRNQKKPTPRVKKRGKAKLKRVRLNAKPSLKAQENNIRVKKDKPPMPKNL